MTDPYPTPASANAPAAPAAPPTTLVGAFWAFIASAAVGVIGALLLFAVKDDLVTAVRATPQGAGLTPDQAELAANIGIIVALVIAVVIAALYLLFAFKLKAGRNWARIVLTVLTVLQVISLFVGSAGSSVVSYVSAVAAVIGVVLAFLKPSSDYINATKAASLHR